MQVPIIDISLLHKNNNVLAQEIRKACSEIGFFYIKNHNISLRLQKDLEQLSQQFFELPLSEKNKISMDKAGKAWRGYFPLKAELTSNLPDVKEGIYFGEEHNDKSLEVINGTPLFGKNLYPAKITMLQTVVENYMHTMHQLANKIMEAIALSLNLEANFFVKNYTQKPTQLFRIFHYPPVQENELWGVGEHTDYGLITILKQDKVGGLQVKANNKWIDAPPIENTFVCNIGDMLDFLTGGFYQSTPHRVKNTTQQNRYSFPYFFDPNFYAPIMPIDLTHLKIKPTQFNRRWDNTNLHEFEGTYGNYILNKIAKVFPSL